MRRRRSVRLRHACRARRRPRAAAARQRSFVVGKARLHDARLKSALAALEREAAKATAMTPVSVMDKGVAPPSGDKHDYMSQAPYWWPDPSKPKGLPYVRRDGERNPEINRITDHGSFDRLMDAVSTLGLAFHLTGRQAYADHAARLVRVWFIDPATRMHPHLAYGQGIPGISEGRGIGIIETRRLPKMLDGVLLIAGSASWRPEDDAALQAWMRSYLAWLTESQHGKEESRTATTTRRGTTSRWRGSPSIPASAISQAASSRVRAPGSHGRSRPTADSRASSNGRARGTTPFSISRRSSTSQHSATALASTLGIPHR